MRLFLLIVGLVLLIAGVVYFWPGRVPGTPTVPAGPAQKVTLRVHHWQGYCREYLQGYKEEMRRTHNLDVAVIATEAPSLDSMYDLCKKRETDLISPPNDKIAWFNDAGLLHVLNLDNIPNFNQIHPFFLDHDYYHPAGKAVAVPFLYGPYALIYNTQKIAKPASYRELWEPQLAGRVSISNEFYLANIYMTALMLKMPSRDLFNLSDRQLAAVEEKLGELCRTQVCNYWDGQFDPNLHEKVDVATDWGVSAKFINDKKWGRWELVIPDEGATAFVDNWCIAVHVEGLPLEAAYGFINYMLSDKVQAEVSRITTYGPVNFYASRYFKPLEKIQKHVNDPEYLNRLILWQTLSKENAARYEAVWKRAKP